MLFPETSYPGLAASCAVILIKLPDVYSCFVCLRLMGRCAVAVQNASVLYRMCVGVEGALAAVVGWG